MSDHIDTRISPSLHPESLSTLDGLDDDTRAVIAPAVDTLKSAYKFIAGIHDVKAAADADPTLTREAALLRADDHAQTKLAAVTRQFDSVHQNFGKAIASLETALSAPVVAKASQMISGEVRAHAKSLSLEQRDKLLDDAMVRGDHDTLSSILGGPHYLSGMTPELHAIWLRRYNEVRDPVAANRLKVLTQARAEMMKRGQTLFAEMTKAVGTIAIPNEHGGPMRHVTAQEVRKKRDASAKVYAQHA
ncbi:hypothetical protein [Frigidibacter oleivorans]|uniref:hypothetical protein n=1 Tax=Frigidibacter oleivorans TaxID=2487129 RepID=UPI000F8DAADD|nr:hypothetical protein [Frigidibacter oleivorans]